MKPLSGPIAATARCFYAISCEQSRWDGRLRARLGPHDDPSIEVAELYSVENPSLTVDRRSKEYVTGTHPVAAYFVSKLTISQIEFPYLPAVLGLALEVDAPGMDGLIQAMKDLYDPESIVLLDGRNVEEWARRSNPEQPFRTGHRGTVATIRSDVPTSRSGDVLATIMQIMAKDLAMEFIPEKTSIAYPDDLNGVVGTEVLVWAESTVIWKLPERLKDWELSIASNTALCSSLRERCDQLSEAISSPRSLTDQELGEQLLMLTGQQLEFSQATAGTLDGYRLRLGKQSQNHFDTHLDHSGATKARDRTSAMIRSHIEALRLEQEVGRDRMAASGQQNARDLNLIVRAFATVSVVLAAWSVGQADIGPTRSGDLARSLSIGALALLISVAFGISVARSSTFRPPERPRILRLTALAVVVAGAITLAATTFSSVDSIFTRPGHLIGLALVAFGSLGVAWAAKLGNAN